MKKLLLIGTVLLLNGCTLYEPYYDIKGGRSGVYITIVYDYERKESRWMSIE